MTDTVKITWKWEDETNNNAKKANEIEAYLEDGKIEIFDPSGELDGFILEDIEEHIEEFRSEYFEDEDSEPYEEEYDNMYYADKYFA